MLVSDEVWANVRTVAGKTGGTTSMVVEQGLREFTDREIARLFGTHEMSMEDRLSASIKQADARKEKL